MGGATGDRRGDDGPINYDRDVSSSRSIDHLGLLDSNEIDDLTGRTRTPRGFDSLNQYTTGLSSLSSSSSFPKYNNNNNKDLEDIGLKDLMLFGSPAAKQPLTHSSGHGTGSSYELAPPGRLRGTSSNNNNNNNNNNKHNYRRRGALQSQNRRRNKKNQTNKKNSSRSRRLSSGDSLSLCRLMNICDHSHTSTNEFPSKSMTYGGDMPFAAAAASSVNKFVVDPPPEGLRRTGEKTAVEIAAMIKADKQKAAAAAAAEGELETEEEEYFDYGDLGDVVFKEGVDLDSTSAVQFKEGVDDLEARKPVVVENRQTKEQSNYEKGQVRKQKFRVSGQGARSPPVTYTPSPGKNRRGGGNGDDLQAMGSRQPSTGGLVSFLKPPPEFFEEHPEHKKNAMQEVRSPKMVDGHQKVGGDGGDGKKVESKSEEEQQQQQPAAAAAANEEEKENQSEKPERDKEEKNENENKFKLGEDNKDKDSTSWKPMFQKSSQLTTTNDDTNAKEDDWIPKTGPGGQQ